jgi:tetratricopeptide (TPR) repeat protein
VSERTKKIETIFHAASELSTAEERENYLNEACLGNEGLRREVDALLKAALAGEVLFQGCEQSCRASSIPAETLAEQPGTMIGRYKLLEKIGEGGMGVVYMAEQEAPVRRKVALKIIKLGMDTRQVVARFEAERQALAMMDHPNIAQVLDGGGTDAGRPFFVMELVQGAPITEFCKANDLSIEERLKLFLPVCNAIQSAHQKGIIHRDLKPSNVLVTMHNGAPHPMVIDFGVAKAIDQKLTEKTIFTNFATLIGTPAYMSPEQAEMSKLDVDTRSDIYSLGILLYELLTGTTPFPAERLRSVAYAEMQRIITEEEPESPSTRLKKKTGASKSAIRNPQSAIDSDLDWIVMKCLEKDRTRRYETANGLASDVGRHLNNEPVLAHPPSPAYRLQRLYQRNKVKFAAAAIAILALVAGFAASTWQAVRATRAERDARAVKDFLIEELLAMNPYMDSIADSNRVQLLERVAQAAGSRFVNQPLIEAEVRLAIGEVSFDVENTSPMVEQFEKALAIRRRLLGPKHSDTLLAMAFTAQAYDAHGRARDTEKLLDEALALVESQARPRTAGEAEVLWTRGSFLAGAGRPGEALSFMERAMPVTEAYFGPKSYRFQNKWVWRIWANIMAGRTNEAEALLGPTIQQAERYFGAEHPVTATLQGQRAALLYRTGRFLEAAKASEQVLAIYQRTIGPNSKRTIEEEFNMARCFQRAGEVHRAAQAYTNVAPRLARFLPRQPYRGEFHTMGVFFASHRDFEAAKAVFGPLRDSYDAKPPEHSRDFDWLIDATAPTKGWAAVAKVYRTYPGWVERDATFQRNMASAFLYGEDRDGYRQIVTNALARALTATNVDEQRRFVDIVGLGRSEFSADELNLCEKLLSLAGTNTAWHRPMAALLLRLGRFEGTIQRLDIALQKKPSTTERARQLMLKAICLSQSGEPGDARTAFDEAEALMKDRLIARLPKEEGFIDHDERACLIHRREAQALLAGKRPD